MEEKKFEPHLFQNAIKKGDLEYVMEYPNLKEIDLNFSLINCCIHDSNPKILQYLINKGFQKL